MKLTPEYISSQVLTCEFDYDGTYTKCTITTHHGSKHTGTSGCLDPANYDREIGEQIAHKNALDQLWALEGYFFSKLGLSQVPGVIDARLGVVAGATGGARDGERWNQHFVSVIAYTQPEPSKVNITFHSIDSCKDASATSTKDLIASMMGHKKPVAKIMGAGGVIGVDTGPAKRVYRLTDLDAHIIEAALRAKFDSENLVPFADEGRLRHYQAKHRIETHTALENFREQRRK